MHNARSPVADDLFEDDFEVNLEEVTLIEKQSQRMESLRSIDDTSRNINSQNNSSDRNNFERNVVRPEDPANKNDKEKENNVIENIDMDDELLGLINEEQFIASTSSTSNYNGNTADREKKNLVKPFRVLPKEDNDNDNGDDIVVVKDKDDRLKRSTTNKKIIEERTDVYFPEDDFNFDDVEMFEVLDRNDSISKNKESDLKENHRSTTIKPFLENITDSKRSATNSTKVMKSLETSKLKRNNISTSGETSSRVQVVDRQIEFGNKRSAVLI